MDLRYSWTAQGIFEKPAVLGSSMSIHSIWRCAGNSAGVYLSVRSGKDTNWEIYRDTGILGGYVPGRVYGMREGNKITPTFRDAAYWITDNGAELHREMLINGRRFIIRSILSASEKAKTPTEQMIQIIDSDLKKDSI